MPVIPALGSLRWQSLAFQAGLSYVVRLSYRDKTQEGNLSSVSPLAPAEPRVPSFEPTVLK